MIRSKCSKIQCVKKCLAFGVGDTVYMNNSRASLPDDSNHVGIFIDFLYQMAIISVIL